MQIQWWLCRGERGRHTQNCRKWNPKTSGNVKNITATCSSWNVLYGVHQSPKHSKFFFPGYSWLQSPSISKNQDTCNKSAPIYADISVSYFNFPPVAYGLMLFFTIIYSDCTIILKWLKAIQLRISIFFMKIQLYMKTRKNCEAVFSDQPAIFLHLSSFKQVWITGVFKHINQTHGLGRDLCRKVNAGQKGRTSICIIFSVFKS